MSVQTKLSLWVPIAVLFLFSLQVNAQLWPVPNLGELTPGDTKAINALWGENPADVRFSTTKCVVVADIKGPAEITMMHFAMPEHMSLKRDLLLRIYWDGETNPSVDVPMVDFFCDPDGTRDVVNTALVNVRRGFNCYFPMSFRKSARVELLYEGPLEPGQELVRSMPCYSYVCYRTLKSVPRDTAYFCASWRQETLKLGLKEYVALETQGKGKLIGWNVTVRHPGRHNYPVDENEKFYIDGETNASVEFQGLEDSFGFSWGFPATENMFPLTGWFPFLDGAAAYRFFLQDSISFQKSLKVVIGFGKTEEGWRRAYSRFGTSLQFSSTVYWYQAGPKVALPPMPPPADREPAPEIPFWPEQMKLQSDGDFKARGDRLVLFCGYPDGEMIYNEPGYSISWDSKSDQWDGWDGEVFYSRSDLRQIKFHLNLPAHAKGTLRLYIIDPDNFGGGDGRKETIVVAGKTVGTYDHFQGGRWIEARVNSDDTADGKLDVRIVNARDGANAVVSKIEWTEKE
jgi:Protein of unknown function (DUF2961)